MAPSPSVTDLVVARKAAIRDVLVVIDRNAQGMAFVVDAQGKLCGVVTDGDIRRALLAGRTLDTPVENVMKRQFMSLPVTAAPEEIFRGLSDRIQFIPLVDEGGKPVDYASTRRHHHIPIMEPSLVGNELSYVIECISTNWISSQGTFIRRFEEIFARVCAVESAIAVSNGTVALHLALVTLGIGAGDEVLVPDLTFAASASAVIHAGAIPVLVDVTPETWTLDVAKAEEAITPRTKAIMPVHLYGHPCDMDPIMRVAQEHGLYVIEDCAEAFGSTYKGKRVGIFGDAGCFSFFGNKMITTGEGGMVIFRDPARDARARTLRDHGMSRERRYWHLDIGYNFRLTNLQAAVGVAQLERIDWFIQRRGEIAQRYRSLLSTVDGVRCPPCMPWATNIHWLYPILLDEQILHISRDDVMDKLALNGIETRPLFYPLHQMPPYRAFGAGRVYPIAEQLSRSGVSLPSAITLSSEDIDFICSALKRVVDSKRLLVESSR